MKEKIIQYLVAESDTSPVVAGILAEDILRHADIAEEFCKWLSERKYPEEGAITVNGYTASAVHQMAPRLEPFGVYSFLVTLREHPDKAEEMMHRNFMEK